jgi:hypothetical protein
MSTKQKIVLWVGILVFVLLGLFETAEIQQRRTRATIVGSTSKATYAPVFIHLTVVAVVTGGLLVTLKDKKDKKPKDEQKQ